MAAKFSPPCALKISRVLDRDLLQRLQAIGGKARRHHREVLHAALRQRLDGLVGVGLQPFGLAEARLEGQHQLAVVELEPLAQQPHRLLRNGSDRDRPRRRRTSGCRGTRRGSISGLNGSRCSSASIETGQRLDIDRLVVIRRHHAQRRLVAQLHQRGEGRVAHRRAWSPRHIADRAAPAGCARSRPWPAPRCASRATDCRSASPSRP